METLNFVNTYIERLPVDPDTSSTPRQVSGSCYVHTQPTPVLSPHLLLSSPSALSLLGLDAADLRKEHAAQYLSGNRKLPGAVPVAHAYCGHQYGLFAGQLGDGAAMTLGTVRTADGTLQELQLKGSGPTPFSRAGLDGRKVVRSSIRELLCSEAMHHLGVPTTRAATCVLTRTLVSRDLHHTGHVTQERAAVVTRIAPSFHRVGSLEVCLGPSPDTKLSGPSEGNVKLLKSLLDYTIDNFYTHIAPRPEEARYIQFFECLVQLSARMVAQWQALGFCHGVLNTDNLSLLGLTMDYGPFAFMETYNPDFICNASDYWGHYSYRNQPLMVELGLERLADVLQMVALPEHLAEKLATFTHQYEQHYLHLMRKKLGLANTDSGDAALVVDLLEVMQQTGADFTRTFRALSKQGSAPGVGTLQAILGDCLCGVDMMREIYKELPKTTPEKLLRSLTVLETQGHLLPKYLEASHSAIDKLNNRPIITHVKSLTVERKQVNDRRLWSEWLDRYQRRLTLEEDVTREERCILMQEANPRFILRNHLLHDVVEAAEAGDPTPCRVLLDMACTPYHPDPTHMFDAASPDHKVALQLLASHDANDFRRKPLHIT